MKFRMSILSVEQLMGGFRTDYNTIQTHLNHNYNEPRKDINSASKSGDPEYNLDGDCSQTVSFKTENFIEFNSIKLEMSRKEERTKLKFMLLKDDDKIGEMEPEFIDNASIIDCMGQLIKQHHSDSQIRSFKSKTILHTMDRLVHLL